VKSRKSIDKKQWVKKIDSVDRIEGYVVHLGRASELHLDDGGMEARQSLGREMSATLQQSSRRRVCDSLAKVFQESFAEDDGRARDLWDEFRTGQYIANG
jgi:hypothetical protein